MDLNNFNIQVLVPGIITLIIFLIISGTGLSRNRIYDSSSEIRANFYPAWWCITGNYFGFVLFIAVLCFPFVFPDPSATDYIVFGPIALVVLLATLWGVYKMHNSVLSFKEDHIYYQYGRRTKIIHYEQIQFAYFANAHFHINIGEDKKQIVIPAMFNDNWLILEQIKRLARGNADQWK